MYQVQEQIENYLNKISYQKTEWINLYNSIKPLFYIYPASISHHHSYEGGLAKHTYEVIKLAINIKILLKYIYFDSYIFINQLKDEDIIKVAFIHDIEKINEYEMNYKGKFIKKQNLYQYLTPELKTIEQTKLFGIHLNENQVQALFSMHGGWNEYKLQLYPLSAILHCADLLSSRFDKNFLKTLKRK